MLNDELIESIVDVAVKIRIEILSVFKLDLGSAFFFFVDSFQVKDQMPAFEAYLEKAFMEFWGYSVDLVLDAVLAVPRYSLHAELFLVFKEFLDLDLLRFVKISDWCTFYQLALFEVELEDFKVDFIFLTPDQEVID